MMKRKDYQNPTTKVVQLKQQGHIMAGSPYVTPGNTKLNEMEAEEDL